MLNEQMMGGMSQDPQQPQDPQPQQALGMPSESDIQDEIDKLSAEDKVQAKEALLQIIQVVEELRAQGASEQEIEQMLAEIGISLDELAFAEKLLLEGDNELGISI